MAGMGGSRATPQWFLNRQAAGKGRIQIGEQEHDVDAHLAGSTERDALWPLVADRAPQFARWQARTGRSLPVTALTVKSPSGLGLPTHEDCPRRASHRS
jgi:deazaflavin-dependent oxidoreductase (nitroreductase family)